MSVILTEAQYAELRGGDMLAHYSAALDEIFRLRGVLAYEATAIDAALKFNTMAKTARAELDKVRNRMRLQVQGRKLADFPGTELAERALRTAGAPTTLTRHQWEHRADS